MKKYILITLLLTSAISFAQVPYSANKSLVYVRTGDTKNTKPLLADFTASVVCYNALDSVIWTKENGVVTCKYTCYPYTSGKKRLVMGVNNPTSKKYSTLKKMYYGITNTVAGNLPVLSDFTTSIYRCYNITDSIVYEKRNGVVTPAYIVYPYQAYKSVYVPPLTNFYVETTGNDNNSGNYGSPVATLGKAATLAVNPGDSIIFGAGRFTHSTQANIAVGVSMRGVDSTQTIINCTYTFTPPNFGAACIVLSSATNNINGNQSITRLKLDGGLVATRAILVRGRGNVLLEKISVQKFFVNGIALYPAGDIYAQPTTRPDGNIIRYSQVRNCGDGVVGWTYGSLIDCYGQANTQVMHNKLINIDRVNHTADIFTRLDFSVGIKFMYNDCYKPDIDGTEAWNFHVETWNIQGGCEFAYNNFYGGGIALDFGGINNTKGTYDFSVKAYNNNFIRNTPGDESKGTHAAIHLEATDECSDIFVFNNYIKNFSNALMISDGSPTASGVKQRLYFFNNLAEDCQWLQSWAMSVVTIDNTNSAASNWHDIYVVNNTFIGKAGKNVYGINVDAIGTTTNIVVKNNIFYNLTNSLGIANFQNKGTRSNYIVQNNLAYLCGNSNNPTVAGTITGYSFTNHIKLNPVFNSDYSIQGTSPAKDAGQVITLPLVGTLPYNGSLPDIGYKEYIP